MCGAVWPSHQTALLLPSQLKMGTMPGCGEFKSKDIFKGLGKLNEIGLSKYSYGLSFPTAPPNKSLLPNWQARFLINRFKPAKAHSGGVASPPLPIV
jgi:hypothetical protein